MVLFYPVPNVKTGDDLLYTLASICFPSNFLEPQLDNNQSCIAKGNKSMYSSFSPNFGCFNLMNIVGEEAFMSFHVRSDTIE